MPAPADRLRIIKNFDGLIQYLEDELEWPLQGYDIEDLTFDWTDDLGLKEEGLVKKVRVYQLRPLAHGQPWGIFFVEFEKKRLPVVVLRRILSRLVVKKRAVANKARSAAWDADDILFISAFGNEASNQREIAFAHFHQESGDLPTLRVLGWDGGDTPLKLDYVDATLKSKLRWPDVPADHAEWREQWSRAFRHRIGHVIRTADALAEKLAELARGIRDAAQTMIRHESERGQLRRWYRAFQTALIHDLTEEDFADTYAQTITYGLLTAAISRTDMSEGRHGTALIADNVADIVPVTNPFLKEMLRTFLKLGGRKGGIDFDELGIQDVVDLLRGEETDLPAILRDFGNKTRGEDPVIHFYEHFLAAYNKRLKVQRGVFYTPQPVVSYIVRSVHELLQTEFGLENGLADTTTWEEFVARERNRNPQSDIRIPKGVAPDSPFVQILDPAVGTATFLVEVIDVIHRTLADKWKKQGLNDAQRHAAWNEYVPKHLLSRLHGFELMMAPYAIAHMKLPLKLKETGFTAWHKLSDNDRARIYLTNALEPASGEKKQMEFVEWEPALAHEAAAVNEIKRHKRFTVVIGNPPYSVTSANDSWDTSGRPTFIGSLIEDYRKVNGEALGERNPKVLQDDYVKFIRYAEWLLAHNPAGIIGLITNHSYLDNITFRGMRYSLLNTFASISVCDLHGNLNKAETAPNGTPDENVFEIRQGVAVLIGVRCNQAASRHVWHSEIWGGRIGKYLTLGSQCVSSISRAAITPGHPNYFLIPQDDVLRPEYNRCQLLSTVFNVQSSCMNTARDDIVIDTEKKALKDRIKHLRDTAASAAKEEFGLKSTGWWSAESALKELRSATEWESLVIPCLYRPFDTRWLFHHRSFIDRPRPEVNRHMLLPNLSLVTTRQTKEPFAVVATNLICGQHKIAAVYDRSYFIPLYLYDETLSFDLTSKSVGVAQPESRRPNFSAAFLSRLADELQLPQKRHGLPADLTPEDIFHYIYAVFHSPSYRSRYAEFLKIDFPRLPLTGNLGMFRALAQLGGELVGLHLVEFALKGEANAPAEWPRYPRVASFTGSDSTIEKFPAADKAWKGGSVAINASSGFEGVPEEVWNFHIGGYQVCHKWLKDRKGRALTDEDILHYCKIVTALNETIRLMRRIDEVINEHGGWPGAFTSPAETKQESQLPFE